MSFDFFSGETEKPCTLILVDDTEHEEEEELRLVLGSPKSESPFGASVGGQNETLLKIKDDADSKSTIFKSVSCSSVNYLSRTSAWQHLFFFLKFNYSHFFCFLLKSCFTEVSF